MRRFVKHICAAALAATMAAHAAEEIPGKTLHERLKQLNTLIQDQPADLNAKLSAAFFDEQDPELVIAAGHKLIPNLKGAELVKALTRVVEFPGPLPAFNLGGDLVRQFAPQDLGQQLVNMVLRQNWWEQRNAVILTGFAQDPRYVPTLHQVLATAQNRVVRLEAMMSLAAMHDPQAVKEMEAYYPTSKQDSSERPALLRMLALCASEADVPWLLQQVNVPGIESVIGAWTITRLTKTLPKDALPLLKNNNPYPRRAALLMLQRLGTKEQWFELLKTAKFIQYPDVLEALGNHFFDEPVPEAAKLFIDSPLNLGDMSGGRQDFRVPDAWCRGAGACAAAGNDKGIKDHLYDLLSKRVNDMFGAKLNDARKKERRELCCSAIYGLAALNTPEARDLLLKLSLEASDEIVALYATYDYLRLADASALEKFHTGCANMRDKGGPEVFKRGVQMLSCGSDRGNVELLIDFLAKAPDESCRFAARDALALITGHDFGDTAGAWQTWWKGATKFVFLEDKFKAIKKDGVKNEPPAKPKEGEYDIQTLDIMAYRKDINAAVARFKGDEDTEAAVNAGLRWLADHQDPDGKWNGVNFNDLNIIKKNENSMAMKLGRQNIDISLSGLAILAFLASNHTQLSEQSIYRETMTRAFEWSIAHQLDDGSFEEVTNVAGGGLNYFNYEQGIMTLAYSEAYGMTHDEELKGLAQRGLNKIFSSQSPGDGWRYTPRVFADTSVCGWMINAIKSGLMCGLEVDPRYKPSVMMFFNATMNRPHFVEDLTDVSDDYEKSVGFEYKEEAVSHYMQIDPRQSTSGTAITAANLLFLGYARSYPFNMGAAVFLLKNLPQPTLHKALLNEKYGVPIYYYYYATLFMHQMGGEDWSKWNSAIKPFLISTQAKPGDPHAGSYPAVGFDGEVGGPVYSTAMCTLTLETYYRYLPMLWFR